MTEVRRSGNFEQWVAFFLHAVAATAQDATETIDRLTAIRKRSLSALADEPERIRANLELLLAYIEKKPIIDIKKTSVALGFSYNTAARYVDILCEKGILSQTSKAGKARIYSYTDYLDLLRRGT